jgi:CO dehydrogenase maturation factor
MVEEGQPAVSTPLKIAVSGKGGAGKTTVTAGLCLALASKGYEVLALDCDPDANLAGALGFPTDLHPIPPLSSLTDLIEERTGVKPGSYGGMFKLNPHVSDIPDAYCCRHGRIKLLVVDSIEQGGSGCACPQNVMMKRLVSEVLVSRREAVIMDMEAGLEHLGRSTASAVSAMVAVVEPGQRSVATAKSILKLAADIGICGAFVLGNRFRPQDHFSDFVRPHFDGQRMLGCVPFDSGIAEADLAGAGIEERMAPATRDEFVRILERMEEEIRVL